MFTLIVILIGLIAAMIVLVVLVQSGKGGGLAGIASGGTTQILGARQAPDVLEKATWTLATLFIVLCVLSNFFIGQDQVQESVIQQRAQQEQTAPGAAPLGQPQDGLNQQAPATPPPAEQPQEGGNQ